MNMIFNLCKQRQIYAFFQKPRPAVSAKEPSSSKSAKKPLIEDAREKRTGKMNEMAQTDLDKGISYSAQEAPVRLQFPVIVFIWIWTKFK